MAETPGEQVDAALDANANAANSEVEAAAQRANEAQAEAARIADAAIATDLGSRIQQVNERLDQWQSNSSQWENRLSSTETAVREQGTVLGAIAGSLQSIQNTLAPAPPQAEQPPRSDQGSAPTGENSTGTDQNARPEDQRRPETPPPPPKKRRFL